MRQLKAHWPESQSVASIMQELANFRKLHPAPAPLPAMPKRNKRNSDRVTHKDK